MPYFRPTSFARRISATIAITLFGASIASAQTTAPSPALLEKPVAESLREFANPKDDGERFQLGIAQTLRAVERLSGSLYKYGLRDKGLGNYLTFLRLPVPINPNPQPVSADAIDAMLNEFTADLGVAIKTLDGMKDPTVKIPVRIGMIPLDLDGEGNAPPTPMWQLLARLEIADPRQQDAEQFSIAFDLGDAKWLQGYCHLLSAMADMVTAYDKKELVQRTGHLFFAKVESPNAIDSKQAEMQDMILDAIAFVHLINLPLKDATHMQSAREHLKSTLALSHASFDAILAETDDEREWIPNDRQTSSVVGRRLTRETIDSWLAFVGDCEQALDGKLLIPFWRNNGQSRGINLKRFFDEPRPFDLVLTIQGTNLAPYMEEGPLANGNSFRRLERLLEGDFLTFAAWVN